MDTHEVRHPMDSITTRRGLKWGGVLIIAGALMFGSIATVAAANGTGIPGFTAAIAPQGAPEGTPTGTPEATPTGTPEGVGAQAENGNGRKPDGVGATGNGNGRKPDGVGAAGNGNVPNLPTLPEQASDNARAALGAIGERRVLIAERLEAMRAVEPGPGRGEQVTEIAKDFGEQFRALAAALAAEGEPEE